MIHVSGLHKRFGKTVALNDVGLELRAGECVALIGPNSCGKTTLIKSILGMVLPDKGEIVFNGKPIYQDVEYRRQIGYMPQIGRYPDNMTVEQMIAMIKALRQHKGETDTTLPERFNLKEHFQKRIHTLSGGTIQKVSATIAFLFSPMVLILDEPTAGLDPVSAEILKEKIIEEKKKGKLILITSHQLSELDEMISSVVFMQEGRIIFHHTLEELKRETGEEKISKVIARIFSQYNHEKHF